jgi:hypothetical protein
VHVAAANTRISLVLSEPGYTTAVGTLLAKHVMSRFPGKSGAQVAQYLKNFAETATPTNVQSGATICRSGAEILIRRPGAPTGGTYFKAESSPAAHRYLHCK